MPVRVPDYIAISLTIFLFFLNCFIFSFFEGIISPITINMYAWSNKEATLYNSIIIGTCGLFGVVATIIAKILVKRISESKLMLGGFVTIFMALFTLISWGDEYPYIRIASK